MAEPFRCEDCGRWMRDAEDHELHICDDSLVAMRDQGLRDAAVYGATLEIEDLEAELDAPLDLPWFPNGASVRFKRTSFEPHTEGVGWVLKTGLSLESKSPFVTVEDANGTLHVCYPQDGDVVERFDG